MTAQEVIALFAQYGAPMAAGAESAEQRAARIAQQVTSGQRSRADVELWARNLGAGTQPSASDLAAVGTTDVAVYGQGGGTARGSDLLSIPEGDQAQIWLDTNTGGHFLAYFIPGTRVPLLYYADQAQVQSMFGPGQAIVVDRRGTRAEFDRMGALIGGRATELSNLTENPFDALASQIDDQAQVRPWLREPDVLAALAQALLEGRELSEAEFQQTNWWKTHTEAQRQWLLLSEADPMEANRLIEQNRVIVADALRQAGASNANPQAIEYMARQFTSGRWDATYLQAQLRAVSDPHSGIKVDEGLMGAVAQSPAGTGLGGNTTREGEDQVRSLVARWLGPAWGAWSESQVQWWAGRLRNDPDAETELTEILRNGRNSVLPNYTNPNATYEDVATPWRSFWTGIWGQVPDERDSLWMTVLAQNDAAEAGKLLRKEGLKRGVGQVVNDVAGAMGEGSGGSIRRAIS